MKSRKPRYLVTASHEESIRIQTFEYPTLKEARADCKKHGWKIQAVQKIDGASSK